ncbi:family transcriptional regulator [Chlorella sorokiniana]|uniref:Family transcriptional regulator n=1 Tax=Chlorella sorokiniana TaxID=3076 RepID=A0A2P6U2Q2_CHLSO|nr:family transcriptional regulator [Chlorella sorokiniana]|eukprot:PRW60591.1 family transcriptional regulator [Chlorella sorokiniana]
MARGAAAAAAWASAWRHGQHGPDLQQRECLPCPHIRPALGASACAAVGVSSQPARHRVPQSSAGRATRIAAALMDIVFREKLREPLVEKRDLDAQQLPADQRAAQLVGIKLKYDDLWLGFVASKAWRGVEPEVLRLAEPIWNMQEQAVDDMLSNLQQLYAIGVAYSDVMGRRALFTFPGFGSVCGGLCSLYCLVTLVFFGWLSVALRCFGFQACTPQMRTRLGMITVEVYALLLVALFSYHLLQLPGVAAAPPAAKALAAITAVMPLIRAVGAAKELWHKDEVPLRQQDDDKLAECLATAMGMAPAGDQGRLAGLARAMAGMLQRALPQAAQEQAAQLLAAQQEQA